MTKAFAAAFAALALMTVSAQAGALTSLAGGYGPGTIVISQRQHRLFFVVQAGEAIAYPVAVAKRRQGVERPCAGRGGKFVESRPGRRPNRTPSATIPNCPR